MSTLNVNSLQTAGGISPVLVSDIAKKSDLAASSGSSLVGVNPYQTQDDVNNERVSVARFGAVGDGVADDTAAINTAISAAAVLGCTLEFAAGVYRVTSTIVWANGVTYRGAGTNDSQTLGTVIKYTGTGDASVVNNPVNSSTFGGLSFEGINFLCTSLSPGKALFYDTGSTYLNFRRCRFEFAGSGAFGLVLDQSEIVTVEKNNFVASGNIGTGAMIWLANGPTSKNPTATTGYTNRITFTDNQINPAMGGASAIGVIDDGGSVHSYKDNNFNGGLYALKLNIPITILIEGNEIEGQTGAGVYFSRVGGGITGLRYVGNFNVAGVPSVKFEAGAVNEITYTDNVHQTTAGVACESGLSSGVSNKIFASNNKQISLGLVPFNNYLQRNVDTVGACTFFGSSVAGVHTYSGNTITWRLIGDVCFFNLYLALSSKDAAMAGTIRIGGLPYPSRAASAQYTSVSVGWASYISTDTGYSQIGAYIPVGQSYIELSEIKPGASVGNIAAVHLASNSQIMISGMYPI